MYILSRVCADFHDRRGNLVHRIGRADLLKFHEVPDAIREDLLFRMLLNDGSIELPPKSEAELKRIENDPTAGTDASGRRIADAGGVNFGDSEVSRNKRAVRGTVAPIEAAEQKIRDAGADETIPETKPAKATKAAGTKAKAETKSETKPETKAETKETVPEQK